MVTLISRDVSLLKSLISVLRVLNTIEDKSDTSLSVSLLKSLISFDNSVDNCVKCVVSLPDKSARLDIRDVTVASLKSVTNNSSSLNVSNDSPAPPMTSEISL